MGILSSAIPWYLQMRNLAIIALACAVAVLGPLYLWQRGTLKEREAQVNNLTAANIAIQGQIDDYKKGVKNMKKAQAEQQKVADGMAGLVADAEKIKNSATIGAEDEKIISDLVRYFNSGGMRAAGSDGTKTGRAVLPEGNKDDASRAGWEVKRVAADIIAPLVEYSLQLEKTVQCYEGGTP
jgi:hypothetical protein